MSAIKHGTRSTYDRFCRKRPEGPCQACKRASADYMATRRARQARERAERGFHGQARTRALWRLAELYPHAYRRLLAEELQRRRDGNRAA